MSGQTHVKTAQTRKLLVLHIDNHLYIAYIIYIDSYLYVVIMTEEKISELCKALGDPNRLKIIKLLTDGEQCACKLLEAFQITQPTLSHHMKILSETGMVSSRKEGKWTYYSISCCMFKEFKSYFDSITCYKDRNDHSECNWGGK